MTAPLLADLAPDRAVRRHVSVRLTVPLLDRLQAVTEAWRARVSAAGADASAVTRTYVVERLLTRALAEELAASRTLAQGNWVP